MQLGHVTKTKGDVHSACGKVLSGVQNFASPRCILFTKTTDVNEPSCSLSDLHKLLLNKIWRRAGANEFILQEKGYEWGKIKWPKAQNHHWLDELLKIGVMGDFVHVAAWSCLRSSNVCVFSGSKVDISVRSFNVLTSNGKSWKYLNALVI